MNLKFLSRVVGLLLVVIIIWWIIQKYILQNVENKRVNVALYASRQLSVSAYKYALDHNGRFPPSERWEELLRPYLPRHLDLTIPAPIGGVPRRLAMNKALSSRPMAEVSNPFQTVIFFESVSSGTSIADRLESLPRLDEHGGGGFIIAYVDGHSEYEPPSWKPVVQSSGLH